MVMIREMTPADWDALAAIRGAPPALFRQYQEEQADQVRILLVAEADNRVAGFLMFEWTSGHPLFRREEIPEILELEVDPEFDREALTDALLAAAEMRIGAVAPKVGLAVSLIPENGSLPRLLIRRGYLPDDRGVFWRHAFVEAGDPVVIDNRLAWLWRKDLSVR